MKHLTAGLIGASIQSTRLPAALASMCEGAGIGLTFDLIDTDLLPGFRFAAAVDDLKTRDWTGVTVTHPYKVEAAQYAGDAMKAEAAHLGASNTLVFGPPLVGHNTDYSGFLSAWEYNSGGAGPGRVAMAGAGGVARALGPALVRLGATSLDIWDAIPERAEVLAAEIGGVARAVGQDDVADAVRGAEGLVNATALGMGEDRRSAIDPGLIGGQSWAFDAVYTPTDTVFLQAAQKAGLTIISGFELFRHMAIRSFAAYTGIQPDPDLVLPWLAELRPG